MQTIKLDVDDKKLDDVINIIKNLKDNVVIKYEVLSEKNEQKDFISISNNSLEDIWDNEEDSEYDKFLKV